MPNPAALRALVSGADEAGDAVRRVIRAYHGSPYDFDRFDASKIGTGEGAQSYGHGLYFAGNEAVARSYRDALERIAMPQTPEEMASDYLRTWHRPDAARQMAETHLQDAASYRIPGERQALIRAAIDLMDSGQAKVLGPRGRMYEVEIDYPEDSLLDWDATLAGQPKRIVDALQSIGVNTRPFSGKFLGYRVDGVQPTGRHAYEEAVSLARRASQQPAVSELLAGAPGVSPAAAQAAVALSRLSRADGSVQAVKALSEVGIPGIKYLDAGSRSAGEGTRNYVMFPGTEDRIRILRKYGLLAPVGAGMTGGPDE